MPAAELSVAGGLLDPGRRRRDRPRPGRGLGRDRRAAGLLGADLRRRRRALQVPAGRLALRGAAAADQVRRALPRRPLRRPARDRRRRTIELDGWPGMIGHNWGTEHAERWVWLEGTGFDGRARHLLRRRRRADQARAAGRPPGSPPGCSSSTASAHRLGGFGKIRSATIEESPTACAFVLPGKDIVVRGRVSAPRKDFVGWVYADPEGPRAQHGQLLGRRPRADRRTPRPAGPRRSPSRAAPPTSSGCARPTTASRSSPTRTASHRRRQRRPRRRAAAAPGAARAALPSTTLRKVIQRS